MLHIQQRPQDLTEKRASLKSESIIPSLQRVSPLREQLRILVSFLLKHFLLISLITLFICIFSITTYLVMEPLNLTIWLVLLVGLLVGLLLSGIIAYCSDWRANLGVSSREMELASGFPVIGVIPAVTHGERFLAKAKLSDPYSRVAEAYRIVATLLTHCERGEDNKVILVTSIIDGENKEVTAANLAYFMAEMGSKVLLIDADLRRPALHAHLSVPNNKGLVNFLLGEVSLDSVTNKVKSSQSMFVITAGRLRKSSAVNLLSHKNMISFLYNAKNHFDCVIINSSPVCGFADTLLLHRLASLSLVVISEKNAQVDEIKNQLRTLSQVGDTVVNLLKVNALKDVVRSEYYKDYSQKRLPRWLRFKPDRKLNLGRRGKKYWSL